MNKRTQQALALAGIAQSAYLVNQLGVHGFAAHDKLNTSLHSLFVTHPKNTLDVYGGISKLRLGLQILEEIFHNGSQDLKSPEVIRYLIGIIHLESKLNGQRDMLERIGRGLADIENRFPGGAGGPADNPDLLEALADLYQKTVSTLPFRIQVTGNVQYLKNTATANTIRATLLTGIRSAVLWRQLGGRRWHFLLLRKRIGREVEFLLQRPDISAR